MSCKRNPQKTFEKKYFHIAPVPAAVLPCRPAFPNPCLEERPADGSAFLAQPFRGGQTLRAVTLEAGFHYNPFPAGGDKRWKHWFVQPELRYWMCQPFGGHFFGAHLMYGVYNVGGMKLPFGLFKGIRSSRYEGDFLGLGVSYGYHFILSPRWSIETSLGVGFLHSGYERYRCLHCGEQTGGGHKNFIAPTRASVSLVYLIN